MAEEKENLTPKQQKAILSLMEWGNTQSAAKDAGISPRTLHRWLKKPHFREAYVRAGERAFEEGLVQLRRLTMAAVANVAEALYSKSASTSAKLRAAAIVFEHAEPAMDIRVKANMRNDGQHGVLVVPGILNTTEWVKAYSELGKYQHTIEQIPMSELQES